MPFGWLLFAESVPFFLIPFIYCGSCRLQYKTTGTALNNPLKTKNQDTNGETYAENNCSSLVLLKVSVFFLLHQDSFTRGNKTKKKPRLCVDNPLLTALYFHSNRGMFTVAYCGVICFFFITQYEGKPCVCALSFSTASNSGGGAVSGPERRSSRALVTFPANRGNSGPPKQSTLDLADLHPFQDGFLSLPSKRFELPPFPVFRLHVSGR